MGAVVFHDSTIPTPHSAVASAPTRVLIVADEQHVYVELLTAPGGTTEKVVMLPPEVAREIAAALSAAAGYVERSPHNPKAA